MTHHDQARQAALVKTLAKAREQAAIMLLYLDPENHTPEDIHAACVTGEQIDQALEALGALVPAEY